ncbi:O-antigen ligase [Pasteurella testudinis DSM 23072]|uniref:O-antigen ligase n=1 Tax=Pasteurella testudinis DSM 23072 TaxID=1122938 RepID=A0A1W1UBZ6_9PAST|nr:O-antigen ligase family protein [Pasteurella testudinis]SMB78573.1 O-antigen ligase [Pasteurella testudinis DSM 23072]SUB52561.1 O-antigen ligase-like protein [Pasteurella testudinis]
MVFLNEILKNKIFEYAMFLSVLGYALFKIANRSVGDVFLTLLFLGTLFSFIINWRILIKNKILWLFALALITQIVSWLHGLYFTPYTPIYSPFKPLANLFYFFILAYWIRGNPYYIFSTLSAYCLGVILACFLHSSAPIDEFLLGLSGQRVDFGITDANHTAALAGAAVLAAGFMLYTFFKQVKNYLAPGYRYSYLLFLIIILIINLLLVYMTLSRAAWLALFIVLLMTMVFLLANNISFNKKSFLKILIILVGFISVTYSVIRLPQIHSRVFEEREVIVSILDKTPGEIAGSSIGNRIKFWYSAIDWVKKYPLLGLGDRDAREFIIQESPYLSQEIKDEFKHLHNGHIEILVSYGLLGLGVVWGIFIIILTEAFTLKSKYKSYAVYAMVIFILYYFTINVFESFFMFKSGELIQTVILGCLYSMCLKQKLSH